MKSQLLLATPNYSKGVQVAKLGEKINYTASSNGVVITNIDESSLGNILVNGNVAVIGGNDYGNEGPAFIPVIKGDVMTSEFGVRGANFIPYKYVMIKI